MKKLIASILVPALLLYLSGCYSTNEITKEEFKEGSRGNATLFTNDMKAYQFDEGRYSVKDDTLQGSGSTLIGEMKAPFTGKIALENISTINVEETDGAKTFLLTIGIIAGVVLVAAAILFVGMTDEVTDAISGK